ncbi:ACT domain-containing protein [Pararhizobium sp. BT-229]|uniref:ACT domain-containing protein n=1 Tax=Pararhizobium sp. BT-229 TaxID=2986923 RepID=UPI0021F6A4D2|nr:ACT domain-containing protein [Pararhizobium sp. BT-229]MCV9960967.1 ACT domain-containing protein [Pararhizobium sp. BT-229]
MTHKLLIRLVDAEYAITRLNIGTPLPEWLPGPGFWTVSSSREEMTVVCRAARIPPGVQSSGGWRCLRIEQHFTFDVPGVLASVLNPLSDAGVGIFANSTFSTDYVFITGSDLDKAVAALKAHGHEIMS